MEVNGKGAGEKGRTIRACNLALASNLVAIVVQRQDAGLWLPQPGFDPQRSPSEPGRFPRQLTKEEDMKATSTCLKCSREIMAQKAGKPLVYVGGFPDYSVIEQLRRAGATIGDVERTIGSIVGGWVYRCDRMTIIHSIERTPHGTLNHVSMSYPDHDPTWEEIRWFKDFFFGDRDAAMILPKAADYVNYHEHCFHLWEIPGGWGIG